MTAPALKITGSDLASALAAIAAGPLPSVERVTDAAHALARIRHTRETPVNDWASKLASDLVAAGNDDDRHSLNRRYDADELPPPREPPADEDPANLPPTTRGEIFEREQEADPDPDDRYGRGEDDQEDWD